MDKATQSLAVALAFLLLASVCRCSEDERAWMVWGSADAQEVFWTASTCETVTVSQPTSPDESAPAAGAGSRSSGMVSGIRALYLYTATHELLWLQGTGLFRAWMDRTGERRLAHWQDNTTSSTTVGSIALFPGDEDAGEPAILFVTGMSGGDIIAAELWAVPPRWPQDVGMWTRVLPTGAEDAPTVHIYQGWLFWTDGRNLRRARASALFAAAARTDSSAVDIEELLPARGAFTLSSGVLYWLSQPATGSAQLQSTPIQHLDPNSYANHTATLHSFHEQEVPIAFAVPTIVAFGMPEETGKEHLYWAVASPQLRARLQRFNFMVGAVEDLCWTGGLERRGELPIQPSALAVYMMPKVCTSVACLYMRVFDSCGKSCAEDVCQTCFLDTDNWLIKIWMPRYARFNNCVWLFPPDEAAWIVRREIEAAKKQGLLPDNFTEVVLPPPVTAPPTTTTTITTTTTTTTTSATTTSTTTTTVLTTTEPLSTTTVTFRATPRTTAVASSIAVSTTVTTVTLTSTTTIASSLHLDQTVDSGVSNLTSASSASTTTASVNISSPMSTLNQSMVCSSAIHDWCAMQLEVPALLPLFAPSAVRSNCSQPWSFEALCSWRLVNMGSEPPCPQQNMMQRDDNCHDSQENSIWMYVAFSTALMMAFFALIVLLQSIDCTRNHHQDAWMKPYGSTLRGAGLAMESTENKARQLAWSSFAPDAFPEVHQSPKGPCQCLRRLFRPARKRMHIAAVPRQEKVREVEQSPRSPGSQSDDMPAALDKPCERTELPRSPQSALTLQPEEWQPSPGKAAAVAAAAGPLTQAMRRTMRSEATEEFRWQCVEDVEDILRVLASQLPREMQEAAWTWHQRQVSRLELWSDVVAAREEATLVADEVSSDLDRRLRAGLQEAEAAAIVAAMGADFKDARHAPSTETESSGELSEALRRVAEFQAAIERLQCRLQTCEADTASPQQELLAAGELLAGQEDMWQLEQMRQDGIAECEKHLQALLGAGASGEEARQAAALESWQELAARWQELGRELETSAAAVREACKDDRILQLAALQHQVPSDSTMPGSSNSDAALSPKLQLQSSQSCEQLSDAAQRLNSFQDDIQKLQRRLQRRSAGIVDDTDPLGLGDMLEDHSAVHNLESCSTAALREYEQALAEAEGDGKMENSRAWRWLLDRWHLGKRDLSTMHSQLLAIYGQHPGSLARKWLTSPSDTKAEHEQGVADIVGSDSSAPVLLAGQLRGSQSVNRLSSYGENRQTSWVSEPRQDTELQDGAFLVSSVSPTSIEHPGASGASDRLMSHGKIDQSKRAPEIGQRRTSPVESTLSSYAAKRRTSLGSESQQNNALQDAAFSVSSVSPTFPEEPNTSGAPHHLTSQVKIGQSASGHIGGQNASKLSSYAAKRWTSLENESSPDAGQQLQNTPLSVSLISPTSIEASDATSEVKINQSTSGPSAGQQRSSGSASTLSSYAAKHRTALVGDSSPSTWQLAATSSSSYEAAVSVEDLHPSQSLDHMTLPGSRTRSSRTVTEEMTSSLSPGDLSSSAAQRQRSDADTACSSFSADQMVDEASHVCQVADNMMDLLTSDQSRHGCSTGQQDSPSASNLSSYAEKLRTSSPSQSLYDTGQPDAASACLKASPAFVEKPHSAEACSTQLPDQVTTLGNGQSNSELDTGQERSSFKRSSRSIKCRKSSVHGSRPSSSRSPNKLSSYAAERRVSLFSDSLGSSQPLNRLALNAADRRTSLALESSTTDARQEPCTTDTSSPSGGDQQLSIRRHPSLAWVGEPSSSTSVSQHAVADATSHSRACEAGDERATFAKYNSGSFASLAIAARRASQLRDKLEHMRSSLQHRRYQIGIRSPLAIAGGLLQELQIARQLANSSAEVAAECQQRLKNPHGAAADSEDEQAWCKLQQSVQELQQDVSAVQEEIAGDFDRARAHRLGATAFDSANAALPFIRSSDQDEQSCLAANDISGKTKRRVTPQSRFTGNPRQSSKMKMAWTDVKKESDSPHQVNDYSHENCELTSSHGVHIGPCSPRDLLSFYLNDMQEMPQTECLGSEQGFAEISEALRRLALFEDQYQQQLAKLQDLSEQQPADGSSSEGRLLQSSCLLDNLEKELRQGIRESEDMMRRDEKSACSHPHFWQQLAGHWRQREDDVMKQRALLSKTNALAPPEDTDTSTSLLAALRRVAIFERGLEQQRLILHQAKERLTGSQAASSVQLELQEVCITLQHLEDESSKGFLECQPISHVARMEMERIWREMSSLWKHLQYVLATLRDEARGLLEIASSDAASSGERRADLFEQTREHESYSRSGRDWGVDCRAALAEAQRRVAVFSEDVNEQKLRLIQKKLLRDKHDELKHLAEERCAVHDLVTSHVRNLAEQEQALERSFEADDQEVVEIESWRQLIGLAELQEARDRLQRKLSVAPPGVSAEELSAAQAQCMAMKDRIAELHAEEAEIQHQCMKHRMELRLGAPGNCISDAPKSLQEAAEDASVRAREVLAQARECLNSVASGSVNPGSLQEQLHLSRRELQALSEPLVTSCVQGKGPQSPKACSTLEKTPTARDVKEVHAEMSCAVETIVGRLGWIGNVSHELLAALQKLFEKHTGSELEAKVMSAVDCWLQQLPEQSAEARGVELADCAVTASTSVSLSSQAGEDQNWLQAKQILEYLAGAARETASGPKGRKLSELNEDFGTQRAAILETWRKRIAGVAEEDECEAQRQREAMQKKALERRQLRRRKKEQRARRWTKPREAVQVSRLEVRRRSSDGESVARALLRQCDEEAEQQARILLQKAEARRSRLGSRTPMGSPTGSAHSELCRSRSQWSDDHAGAGLSNSFNHSLSSASLTGTSWAWARSRHSVDACVESGHEWPASDLRDEDT